MNFQKSITDLFIKKYGDNSKYKKNLFEKAVKDYFVIDLSKKSLNLSQSSNRSKQSSSFRIKNNLPLTHRPPQNNQNPIRLNIHSRREIRSEQQKKRGFDSSKQINFQGSTLDYYHPDQQTIDLDSAYYNILQMEKKNNKNGLYCLQDNKYRVSQIKTIKKNLVQLNNCSQQQFQNIDQQQSIWDINREKLEQKQKYLKKNYTHQLQQYLQEYKQRKRNQRRKYIEDSKLEQQRSQLAAQQEQEQLKKERELIKQKKRIQFQMLKEQQQNNFWI